MNGTKAQAGTPFEREFRKVAQALIDKHFPELMMTIVAGVNGDKAPSAIRADVVAQGFPELTADLTRTAAIGLYAQRIEQAAASTQNYWQTYTTLINSDASFPQEAYADAKARWEEAERRESYLRNLARS